MTQRKFRPLLVLLGVFMVGAHALGTPVLLAELSNEKLLYGDDLIEEWKMNDAFMMGVLDEGQYHSLRLFEEHGVLVRVNEAPITIHRSVSTLNDPELALIARYLTDGVSYGENLFQDLLVLGVLGGEDILDVLVPRFSEFDLAGYNLERIDRHLTFSMVSPGRDLNGDGLWTDFLVEGTYGFYGSRIPEPATLTLLAVGTVAILRRTTRPRRRRFGHTCR
ncbi:MAG: hypothetical protein IH989_06380 [Planctomycetes bacterium]|nr:hypothetical protein [Planctomycetota bacterium]